MAVMAQIKELVLHYTLGLVELHLASNITVQG
jgi:hypothetical protein